MPVRDISRDAVESALQEFHRTRLKAMLKKYGGGPATRWYVEVGTSHYDQKLLVRAAHVHQGLGPFEDFTASQAKGRLKTLGYRGGGARRRGGAGVPSGVDARIPI